MDIITPAQNYSMQKPTMKYILCNGKKKHPRDAVVFLLSPIQCVEQPEW
jgi:hypothetical protein